jgi:4-amino-4-deoxy-L-arabinose transferase-like glycosyltransferase
MDIGQGAGLSGASGVRPFLPALLAGALARENSGIDFSGTDFSFLESPAFLLVVLVLAVGSYALQRRRETVAQTRAAGRPGDPRASIGGRRLPEPTEAVMLILGLVLGALLFAGSLADGHHTSWPGILGGIACAALGWYALASLFRRAQRRVSGSGGAVALLGLYADGIALVLAGLSILFPPIAYAALVVFLVLIARSRGEGAQKYEGLRSLR